MLVSRIKYAIGMVFVLLISSMFVASGILPIQSTSGLVVEENILEVESQLQHKDTGMLCLGGCELSGNHAWDKDHSTLGCLHDFHYCVRAGISMIATYFGGNLSQDRISYEIFKDKDPDGFFGPIKAENPEGDLGHGKGVRMGWVLDNAEPALSWALNDADIEKNHLKPSFDDIKGWINEKRPILWMYSWSNDPWWKAWGDNHGAHVVVITGYAEYEDAANNEIVFIDPWNNQLHREKWSELNFNSQSIDDVHVVSYVPPADSTAISDEDDDVDGAPDTSDDSDGDGVVDFDENYRFFTDPTDSDTDGDGIGDLQEIMMYTFNSTGAWHYRNPDPDNDGLRPEKDIDSDDGGVPDDWEDLNGNGVIEQGETDPLNRNDDHVASINKGLEWLARQQQADGSWYSNVGVTSLATLTFLNAGYDETNDTVAEAIAYLLQNKHQDGTERLSIHNNPNRATYHTSMAVLALKATHNDDYQDEIEQIKNWLVWVQWDDSSKYGNVDPSSWYWGGWGYGSHSRPDLSNTQWAVMALNAAGASNANDENVWEKAITFVSRCQARDVSNDRSWADGRDSGGFIYCADGTVPWGGTRDGYGSITSAGIWSLKLAGLPNIDPRIENNEAPYGGIDWIEHHYSWEGNPGLGSPVYSLFYYYITLSKALVMDGKTHLVVDGSPRDWVYDMFENITKRQQSDGSWQGDSHGWENVEEISTAYAILAMQTRSLPAEADLWMSIILSAPGDMHIYDSKGRHTGKIYDAQGEWNNKTENNIPGSIFKVVNGKQIVNLSQLTAGSYRIEILGNGSGIYNLTIKGVQDGEEVQKDYYQGHIDTDEIQASNVIVTSMEGSLTIFSSQPAETAVISLSPEKMSTPAISGGNVSDSFEITSKHNDTEGVLIYATDFVDTLGNQISRENISFNKNDLYLSENTTEEIEFTLTVPKTAYSSWYAGFIVIETSNAGTKQIQLTIPLRTTMEQEPVYSKGTKNNVTCKGLPDDRTVYYQFQYDTTANFSHDWRTGWTPNNYSVIDGLNDGQIYYYRVHAKVAGNINGWSNIVNSTQDASPPHTFCRVNGTEGEHDWHISNIIVSLNSEDNISGVNSTYYRLNDGEWIEYNQSISITTEGEHQLEYYSIDNVNNSEDTRQKIIKIDKTRPCIALTRPKEPYLYIFDYQIMPLLFKPRIIGKITVKANESDNISGILKVQFYFDGKLAYNSTEQPFFNWTCDERAIIFHKHAIQAKAIDYAGHTKLSDEIQIWLFNV